MPVDAPAVAVVPLVPTALFALPEPVTVADVRPDPLALALARSPLLVALEPDVPARSEAASRSRSRVVAVALADASGCSVVADAALLGLLAVAAALVLGEAVLPTALLLVVELCAVPDAGVAIVPTTSTRCPT